MTRPDRLSTRYDIPLMTDRTRTKVLLMAATVVFAVMPLYLTSWNDAIYDGALLVLTFSFSADAFCRCVDPANRKELLSLVFTLGSVAVLVFSALQYGPIANDLRRQGLVMEESVTKRSIDPVLQFERERQEDKKSLPNNSIVLLAESILAEFSVIMFVEI